MPPGGRWDGGEFACPLGRCRHEGKVCGKDCSASSSNPMMDKNSCAHFEVTHQPFSYIDTEWVDSLKALDPERPIREADIDCARTEKLVARNGMR